MLTHILHKSNNYPIGLSKSGLIGHPLILPIIPNIFIYFISKHYNFRMKLILLTASKLLI